MSAEGSTKAILAALAANLGIAAGKFAAFLLTGATSMLAESIHSVADSANQGLLLLGGRRGRRAPTASNPFGFGRERYFWSFVVALVLFSLGGAFALFEGIEKLLHPHEVEDTRIALGVLMLAIGLESFSLRTAVREAKPSKGDRTWWHFIRSSRSPELPVVLLEDVAAIAGLVLALIAVLASTVTDNSVFDALGTMAIGILLLGVAVILMIEMKGLLIGETATSADEEMIVRAVETQPCVRSLIHMRTQHLGPEDLLVAVKIELAGDLEMIDVATAINDVEAAIRSVVPAAKMIYVEPDVRA